MHPQKEPHSTYTRLEEAAVHIQQEHGISFLTAKTQCLTPTTYNGDI